MDQKQLRLWESRCTEENAPWCAAACPLHLDGRALAAQVAASNWQEAWKVLLRTMPLPGILGRICDAPCRQRCQRGSAGDPIALQELERACVSQPAPSRPALPAPAKAQRVAVLGSGLGGLCAAWDLARKGYQVTIFCPHERWSAALKRDHGHCLPAEALREELGYLTRLGVKLELAVPLAQPGWLEKCLEEWDGVYLSLDGLEPGPWPLLQDEAGQPEIPSPAQTTGRPHLFAGGLSPSPVWRAAQGRWAATSLDRYLQEVSPTAGRDKDLPYESGLYTSLEGVEPSPQVPVSDAQTGYSPEQASAEAARCLQCHCLECVKVCPYLERFGAYPKKYAREIYNNQSMAMGARQANRLINSCSLCGLCSAVCPQDFPMQEVCLTARREMVAKGKMPPSAHEFALLDMEFSLGPEFALARHEPGQSQSAQVFFPGCQLAASDPELVVRVYDHLRDHLDGGVGLMLACCGAPALWSGQEEMLAQALAAWRSTWEQMGGPPLILACSSCHQVFREHLPQVELRSLWGVLLETKAGEPAPSGAEPLAVHDPCTTRDQPAWPAAARDLLARLGRPLEELKLSGPLTECCGYGGLMQTANPALAKEVVRRRSGQSPRDYVTYCAVCRDNLAGVGKRALHLLDLVFPGPGQDDPAARPRPGWSQRRENRSRLKDWLVRELWAEETPKMQAHRKIKLFMDPPVREMLEERRILIEDVQKVIHQAEASGDKLVHPGSGHFLAATRPHQAAFWVEYTPQGDGFQVHKAYSHRMTVKAGGRL